ncbi:hypothetical protein H6G91_17385 [Nostoc muscorum FACHB-395]|uniref:hypothetical protein n=1 Tax=Nostoc sp. C057 TaxID=2576903 RepID=UPI0015C3CD72|nr:hypothetical protein [Nostoc sp. C057]MBD2509039.1 hypothetical protein [Desmonostoc muscorum FACHB-395]QLE51659.1 hypothetical protein FD724_28750 [Nostoc sp. C057]
MLNGLRQKAIVKPGGIVKIRFPELPAGATVEVIVLMEPSPEHSEKPLTSFIGSVKGNFATPEKVDKFIRQERDAWEF